MARKEILIGLFVVLVIAGVVIGVRKARSPKNTPLSIPTPSVSSQIESKFNLTIPSDVERIDLTKVGNNEGMGIATRKFAGGVFSHMILADLGDPASGMFYQGWLQKNDGSYLQTGTLTLGKGGYILEFNSNKDYSDYKKVIVSLESGSVMIPSEIVLQGSF